MHLTFLRIIPIICCVLSLEYFPLWKYMYSCIFCFEFYWIFISLPLKHYIIHSWAGDYMFGLLVSAYISLVKSLVFCIDTPTLSLFQVVIQTRKNADISIAALDPETDSRPKTPKERPISAPGTRGELTTAQVSAGETQAIEHAQSRPMSCKPRFLDQIIQDNEAAWREEEGEDEGLIVRGKSRRDLQKYLNGWMGSPFIYLPVFSCVSS